MKAILGRIEGMRVYLPPLDAGFLKYFAAVIMVIDHAAYAFLERAYTADGRMLLHSIPNGALLCRILRAAGRQAFPIFCFFLVESLFHTRSRVRYFLRLVLFAAVSQVPFQQCFFQGSNTLHTSVMCTLAIGFLAIWVIEELGRALLAGEEDGAAGPGSVLSLLMAAPSDKAPARDLVRTGIFLLASGGTAYGLAGLAQVLHTDYSYGGVVLILILYILRDYRATALLISWLWMWWYNGLEVYAAPAFLMLACYNGKRGRQSKYFFYLFYPLHLTVLWLLRRCFFGM